MECQNALEILNVARPDSDDLREVELAMAAKHVQSCAGCEETLRLRQLWDRQVGRLIREVPVPAELKNRLLAAVKATESSRTATEDARSDQASVYGSDDVTDPPAAPQSIRWHRRGWVRAAALTAAGLLAALTFWLLPQQATPMFTLHQILHELNFDLSHPPDFNAGFTPMLPGEEWRYDGLQHAGTVYGLHADDDDGKHAIALMKFSFRRPSGSWAAGFLLAVPNSSFEGAADLPKSFNAGDPHYVTKSEQAYAAVAWSQNGLVYVCFIPRDEEAMQALERILHGAAPV